MRSWVLAFSGAALFAVACHLGLWLLVVAMAASALVLLADEHLRELTRARRVAAWALYAPRRRPSSSELERTIAADLATAAGADRGALDAALSRAERAITNPWRRALGTERIDLARQLAAERRVPSAPALLSRMSSPASRLSAVVATAVFFGAGVTSSQPVFIVPTAASVAVLGLCYSEARRRGGLPRSLCKAAATLLPPHGLVMAEASVVTALTALSAGRRGVLARATVIVARTCAARKCLALQRIAAAQRVVSRRRDPTLTRLILSSTGVAVFITAAIEVAA